MRIAIWSLLALSLTTGALGGEIVRYRAPDGTLGFAGSVTDVPEGAEVLSITPAPEPSPPPPRPDAKRSVPAERSRALEREVAAEAQEEERWAAERLRLDEAVEGAQAGLEKAIVQRREQCWRRSRRQGRSGADGPKSCEEAVQRLTEAERALSRAQGERGELEERCRLEGCLPGWIRD